MKKWLMGIVGITFLVTSGCATSNTQPGSPTTKLSTNEDALKWFELGTTYVKAGLYDDAVNDFTQAIKSDPDFSQAYYSRGYVLGRLGKAEEAIQDFTKTISLNPGNANAYADRGVAYGSLGKHDSAIADFTQAIHLNPDLASAYYNRAVGYLQEKKCIESRKDLQKAQSLGYVNIRQRFLDEVNKECPENQ